MCASGAQLTRAADRKRKACGDAFAFIEALHTSRKQRKDAIDGGVLAYST